MLSHPCQDAFRSQLDLLVKQGAQRMLRAALDAEVDAFPDQYRDRSDGNGRLSQP